MFLLIYQKDFGNDFIQNQSLWGVRRLLSRFLHYIAFTSMIGVPVSVQNYCISYILPPSFFSDFLSDQSDDISHPYRIAARDIYEKITTDARVRNLQIDSMCSLVSQHLVDSLNKDPNWHVYYWDFNDIKRNAIGLDVRTRYFYTLILVSGWQYPEHCLVFFPLVSNPLRK